MVNITKWVLLGGSLILLGLFTKEAANRGLTSTLQRAGIAGQSIGTGLSGIGSGIGDTFRGLLTPLWEVGNFAKSFGFGSPNISGQGYSTTDPQSNQERIMLTGQGGGFDDAEQQGGGDTGVNTDPIGSTPNWFNFNPFPQASGIYDVGGDDIKISNVFGQALPLSSQARSYYSKLESDSSGGGGGTNNATGSGGGFTASKTTSSGSIAGTSTAGWGRVGR